MCCGCCCCCPPAADAACCCCCWIVSEAGCSTWPCSWALFIEADMRLAAPTCEEETTEEAAGPDGTTTGIAV
uniref:Putative secreted peptide n=1 Tax=Anopheles braziliensis TaxID=58242 RepID=A0A2M3ZTN5_9DIPT